MELIKKGQKRLIIIIIVYLIFSFLTFVFSAASTHADGNTTEAIYELLQGMFRFTLESLLFFFIYKGYNWARITALVLLYLGAAGSLLMTFLYREYSLISIIMFVVCAVYILICLMLHSKPIKAYQQYKKNGNMKEKFIDGMNTPISECVSEDEVKW